MFGPLGVHTACLEGSSNWGEGLTTSLSASPPSLHHFLHSLIHLLLGAQMEEPLGYPGMLCRGDFFPLIMGVALIVNQREEKIGASATMMLLGQVFPPPFSQ